MKNIDDPDNDVKAVYQTQMNISIVMMVVSVLLIIFVSFI
jgi:competence protein ComGC